jgi:hypothetical protein
MMSGIGTEAGQILAGGQRWTRRLVAVLLFTGTTRTAVATP